MATYEEPDTSNALFNQVSTPRKFFSIIDGNRAKTKTVSIPMLMLISCLVISTQLVREVMLSMLGISGDYHYNDPPEAKALRCINPIILILAAPAIGYLSDKAAKHSGSRLKYLRRGFEFGILGLLIFILSPYHAVDLISNHTTDVIIALVIFHIWIAIFTTIVEIKARLLIADYAGKYQVWGSVFCQIWISTVSTLSSHRALRHPDLSVLILITILVVAIGFVVFQTLIQKLEPTHIQSGITAIFPPEFGLYMERRTNTLLYMERRSNTIQICCLATIMFLTTYSFKVYSMYVSIDVKHKILLESSRQLYTPLGELWEATFSLWESEYGLYVQTDKVILPFFVCPFILALPKLVQKFGCKKVMIIFLIPQALIILLFFTVKKGVFLVVQSLVPLTTMVVTTLSVPYLLTVSIKNADIGLGLGIIFATKGFAQVLPQIFVHTSGFYGYQLPLFAASVAIICAFGFSAVSLQNKA